MIYRGTRSRQRAAHERTSQSFARHGLRNKRGDRFYQRRVVVFDVAGIERQLLPLLGPDGNELFGPPKSKYGVRTIRLPAAAMDRLRGHRRKVTEILLRYGKRLAGEMPVVCSDRGYPIDVKLLTAWAGRRGIKLHNLRHWHLSELVNSGRPLAEVAKIAGHSSAVITARIRTPPSR